MDDPSSADELRAAGHVVHTPDLYDGNTFTTLADGTAHAQQVGFGANIERGEAAVASLGSLPDYDAAATALVRGFL